ncbi:MAG: hypothetical protein KDD50_10360 [Bdellovibrionales bacterium]|nr:hypothetical protein [Bdellovibrionales bacterium]
MENDGIKQLLNSELSDKEVSNSKTLSIIGPCCRLYRIAAEMTQLQISQILGYQNSQMISNFERGLCKLPPKSLFKYGQLCEIPKEVIVGLYIADNLKKWSYLV